MFAAAPRPALHSDHRALQPLNNARTDQRMDAPHLDTLNPQQRAAATAPRETPLLIIAGAGTGKTNTLAHRVAHLIHTGVNPARILLLTFTRRAAAEMTLRAEGILKSDSSFRLHPSAFSKIWS